MDSAPVLDDELAVLALDGDAAALAALLERCRPSLYATAVGMLGNRADALDAVQDTCVVALLRMGELRAAGAARAWLHAVLRNNCLMRIRRQREVPAANVDLPDTVPGPEVALEQHVMRDWVWQALDELSADERAAVILRHFTRCTSYEAIAKVTGVPVGTVRSRLNRARSRLAEKLIATAADAATSHAELETSQRRTWADFYRVLHDQPTPRTYRDLFTSDVDVRDPAGHWRGIEAWSAEERDAISMGVRASVVDVLASTGITVVEVDFTNPDEWPRHCPPHATFVHRVADGRSDRVRIHYPEPARPLGP
jgi:RNA polymerase sigma factor (sigma-70 family)